MIRGNSSELKCKSRVKRSKWQETIGAPRHRRSALVYQRRWRRDPLSLGRLHLNATGIHQNAKGLATYIKTNQCRPPLIIRHKAISCSHIGSSRESPGSVGRATAGLSSSNNAMVQKFQAKWKNSVLIDFYTEIVFHSTHFYKLYTQCGAFHSLP